MVLNHIRCRDDLIHRIGAIAVCTGLSIIGSAVATAEGADFPARPEESVESTDYPSAYSRIIGSVSALHVRDDIWLLTANNINTVLETGPDGAIVVDPGPAEGATPMLQAIRAITSAPIRYVINTAADADLTGADAIISAAGYSFLTNEQGRAAPVVLRENALLTMLSAPETAASARKVVVQAFARQEMTLFVNGQSVHIISQAPSHSNGDLVVQFQRSDVVITGNVFDDTAYPVINRSTGGSLRGEVDALNTLVNGVVSASQPIVGRPAGPWLQAPLPASLVIPIRGPLCDQQDLVTYRDMVMTVQERIEALVKQHKSEEQVNAAQPLQGFETRYARGDRAAASAFILASYQSLIMSRSVGQHE
jgi:glyoxylase-like metal-dependent hydrolase (beta-lactamase superfamily II)